MSCASISGPFSFPRVGSYKSDGKKRLETGRIGVEGGRILLIVGWFREELWKNVALMGERDGFRDP